MQAQQLNLPSFDDLDDPEVLAAEHQVLQACPSLERLDPRQVRFVLIYTQADSSTMGMQQIADAVGISRAQAHRWRNDEMVQMAMVEVCQRLCDHSCRRLSAAAMYLAEQLATELRTGTKRDLTRAEQYLLDLAIRRTGLDAPTRRSLTLRDAAGNSAEFAEETGSLDAALAQLRGRAGATVAADFEHESCDDVAALPECEDRAGKEGGG